LAAGRDAPQLSWILLFTMSMVSLHCTSGVVVRPVMVLTKIFSTIFILRSAGRRCAASRASAVTFVLDNHRKPSPFTPCWAGMSPATLVLSGELKHQSPCLGAYTLVAGRAAHGRPVWRHERGDRFIAKLTDGNCETL
jgi:hypothetical protein